MPWSRRAFVKGCAAASGAALLAAGATWTPQLGVPVGPRRVEYVGATLLGGPAVRGVPLLPLRTDAAGLPSVDPSPAGWGAVLDWYKYCAREDVEPLQAWHRPQDEHLRYFQTREKLQDPSNENKWYADRLGTVANVADFAERGRGAPVAWRSVGQQGKGILPGVVIRLDPRTLTFEGADAARIRDAFLVPAADGDVLAACHAACSHFCCTMGWHESPLARHQGAWDTIFCTCHLVTCDPVRIKPDFFLLGEP